MLRAAVRMKREEIIIFLGHYTTIMQAELVDAATQLTMRKRGCSKIQYGTESNVTLDAEETRQEADC